MEAAEEQASWEAATMGAAAMVEAGEEAEEVAKGGIEGGCD